MWSIFESLFFQTLLEYDLDIIWKPYFLSKYVINQIEVWAKLYVLTLHFGAMESFYLKNIYDKWWLLSPFRKHFPKWRCMRWQRAWRPPRKALIIATTGGVKQFMCNLTELVGGCQIFTPGKSWGLIFSIMMLYDV